MIVPRTPPKKINNTPLEENKAPPMIKERAVFSLTAQNHHAPVHYQDNFTNGDAETKDNCSQANNPEEPVFELKANDKTIFVDSCNINSLGCALLATALQNTLIKKMVLINCTFEFDEQLLKILELGKKLKKEMFLDHSIDPRQVKPGGIGHLLMELRDACHGRLFFDESTDQVLTAIKQSIAVKVKLPPIAEEQNPGHLTHPVSNPVKLPSLYSDKKSTTNLHFPINKVLPKNIFLPVVASVDNLKTYHR